MIITIKSSPVQNSDVEGITFDKLKKIEDVCFLSAEGKKLADVLVSCLPAATLFSLIKELNKEICDMNLSEFVK